MNITQKEVQKAASEVLGGAVFNAMVSSGLTLPNILEAAALKAFREDWASDGNLDRIRGALLMLEQQGYFSFAEE